MTITKAKCTTQITDVRPPLPEHIHIILVNQKSHEVVHTTVGWSYVHTLFRCRNVKFAMHFQTCTGRCGGTGTHMETYWSLESCLVQLTWKMGIFEQCRHTQRSVHTGHATVFPLRRNVYQVTWTTETQQHLVSTCNIIPFFRKIY